MHLKAFNTMKKYIITAFILIFIFSSVYTQRWKLKRYEAIVGVGTTNIFGDVGLSPEADGNLFGLKDIQGTRPSAYLGIRYKLFQDQSIRLNFLYGFGNGEDEGNNTERGYSFTTMIFEPSLQYEYYFIREERKFRSAALFNRRGMINNFSRISAYAFAGVGGALYIPDFKGEATETAELGEQGFAVAFPGGIGAKYAINSDISIGIELGGRYVLSDYLDGVTTQYSNANDVYYFGLANLVYKLRTNRKGIPVIFEKSRRRRRPGSIFGGSRRRRR